MIFPKFDFLQLFVISACNEQNGGCNLYGTKGCSEYGNTCVCRPGFIGDNCQYCVSDQLIISGQSGMALNKTGYGVKCSK